MKEIKYDEKALVDICSGLMSEKDRKLSEELSMSIDRQCLTTIVPLYDLASDKKKRSQNVILHSDIERGEVFHIEIKEKDLYKNERIYPINDEEQKDMVVSSIAEVFNKETGKVYSISEYLRFNKKQVEAAECGYKCKEAIYKYDGVVNETLQVTCAMFPIEANFSEKAKATAIEENILLLHGMIDKFEIPSDYVSYLSAEIDSASDKNDLLDKPKTQSLKALLEDLKHTMGYNISTLLEKTRVIIDEQLDAYKDGLCDFASKGPIQLEISEYAVKALTIQEQTMDIPCKIVDDLKDLLFTNVGVDFKISLEETNEIKQKLYPENKINNPTKPQKPLKDLSYLKH